MMIKMRIFGGGEGAVGCTWAEAARAGGIMNRARQRGGARPRLPRLLSSSSPPRLTLSTTHLAMHYPRSLDMLLFSPRRLSRARVPCPSQLQRSPDHARQLPDRSHSTYTSYAPVCVMRRRIQRRPRQPQRRSLTESGGFGR